jgi:hypothetical protein
MDQARKKDRRGIAIFIAVLVVVCAWWLLFVPRTEVYKNYKEESDLKRTLRAIAPPAGATLKETHALRFPAPVGVILVASYVAPSGLDGVESHYKQEFPRHGFVYQPKAIADDSDFGLRFCAPGYDAKLGPPRTDGHLLTYLILLQRRDGPC